MLDFFKGELSPVSVILEFLFYRLLDRANGPNPHSPSFMTSIISQMLPLYCCVAFSIGSHTQTSLQRHGGIACVYRHSGGISPCLVDAENTCTQKCMMTMPNSQFCPFLPPIVLSWPPYLPAGRLYPSLCPSAQGPWR